MDFHPIQKLDVTYTNEIILYTVYFYILQNCYFGEGGQVWLKGVNGLFLVVMLREQATGSLYIQSIQHFKLF
ncbi:hypothetical protein C3B51_11670 [Pseudoalteromonas rubra]|uniref:Uncharacterized protein n=1 Tax=Pseudoalteromonas rubra TaxID=43658 RepID=A0A4Q7ECZ8_9GAMM|nr:hypothetical protein C3B51_11670 [Pseudoalteromonas rubra]